MKYPKDFINQIIHGDCIKVMKYIPDNVIDLVVTSPPYDNLRDYQGYQFNFESIADELFRIIKDGGVIVWIVSDSVINGSETGTSFKQALYFKKIGFNIHDTMIYEKTGLSYPSNNRYHQHFEYMFVFSKGKIKTFNPILDRIIHGFAWRKQTNTANRQKDGTFVKRKIKKTGKLCNKMRFNIWKYKTGFFTDFKYANKHKHPAVFPDGLANDHIISWSNENDIILDPMCGSGTTCRMAKKNRRKYIGIDIAKAYCNLAERGVKDISIIKGAFKRWW